MPGIVDYFLRLGCPFTVIIVDDGSTADDTFEAAEQLAQHYPGYVQAVHHSRNKGYGAALQNRAADLAVGYRIARADSLKRRVMGRGWHWLSGLVLGSEAARDVDCGFKLFTRAAINDVEPRISGRYAAVSPEILARALSAGYTMVEAGVTHKSRHHGRQTGSDLKVVILSLACLFQLRLTLRTER